MFSRNRVNGSEVWTRLCRCGVPAVVEPPTASRRNGTGVLWVLTGTHRCDDPPKQGGESSERQLVQCVVAWVRALWMSCKVLIGAIFDHTPSAEHTCRGFRRLEYHLFVETHPIDLCSCTPRVHLLNVATTSTRFHIHVNSIELCSRRHFTILGHAH